MSKKFSVNKYIDFKINGRLFPSWILKNFKKYKLPEIIKRENEDPCNIEQKLELRKYQEFLGKYLDFRSPYHDILVYHGLGSGKTASSINIYNVLYNYTPAWNVFLLIKASLHQRPWLVDLKTWLTQEEYEFRFKNLIFIHYDSPFADRNFMDAIKSADSSKKNMYIIDEAHNFIRNVYTNINSKMGKRAQVIYDYMIQDKKENEGTRVVCLSGTPAINTPYELALMFNLLRPGIFPKSESQFNHMYFGTGKYQTINTLNKNMFQRRILGLVSYYIGSTPDYFPSKREMSVEVEMSDYQADIYTFYEEIEEAVAKKKRKQISGGQETYRSYTRQSCNFVFPPLSQKVSGENRPRPGKFRLSEKEAEALQEGKDKLKLEKMGDKVLHVQEYLLALETFIKELVAHFDSKHQLDLKNKYTITDDVDVFLNEYKGNYEEFFKKHEKKSELYSALYLSSAKFLNVIFNIFTSPGPVLVYSNYVLMEGLQIFKIYLKYFSFASFKDEGDYKYHYAEFHGGIKDQVERANAVAKFNELDNKHGEKIKIIMISPAGAEGLSLMNVRQVHIVEPYWHEVRITQMIGRAVRICSHKHLPFAERHVDVYRYKSIRKNKKWTTDQYIEELAKTKDGLIQSFLDTVKEAAIDCVLNKNHNMMVQEYKCFQFDEPSLFEKQIGPAYKEDLYDDKRIDNGSNSLNSVTVKVKVQKIKAVRQLTHEDEFGNAKYSKFEIYWYNYDSKTVYDYELHYAIGKISVDDEGVPKKLDKETYIIDSLIPIPMIDNE
jgi:superfamily II DNA or RNA helicase